MALIGGDPNLITDDIKIPDFFICKVNFSLMKDPVTLDNGMTYDKENI